MIKLPLILMMLLGVVPIASALQIKSIVDNETTIAKISSIDVTRIFVQGDRIKNVKGIKGAYIRENDEKNGEIYLQPTPFYQQRAFTILIHTESGHHFTLLLNPTASPSETLMLIPKGVGNEQARHFERASSYELTLVNLMRAMKNGEVPKGYRVQVVVNSQKYFSIGKSVVVRLKTLYQGYHFTGQIFSVVNKASLPVRINEHQFYTRSTRAVSLDHYLIPAQSTIHLYRIIGHE